MGYTGVVAANRMYDEIRRIENATQTILWRKDKIDLSGEFLDIEIPESKLSLSAAIGLLEDFLHITPTHIITELIFASGDDWHEVDASIPKAMEHIIISVRLTGDKLPPHWKWVTVSNPDEAVKLAAREALEMTDPYILGMYIDEVELNYKAALALMQEASEQYPNNSYIYDGWAAILEDDHQYDEAISKCEEALKLNPKNDLAYVDWGNALYEKRDYDGAIAKYQQALSLDPQNAGYRARLEAAQQAQKQHK